MKIIHSIALISSVLFNFALASSAIEVTPETEETSFLKSSNAFEIEKMRQNAVTSSYGPLICYGCPCVSIIGLLSLLSCGFFDQFITNLAANPVLNDTDESYSLISEPQDGEGLEK